MATKNLAKDICKLEIDNPSKTIDMSLLKNKIVYAATKYYSEETMLDHMTSTQLRSLLKRVRKSALDDLKHLKSIAVTSGDSISGLDVISSLGFILDNDDFFQTIQSYVFIHHMSLTEAILQTVGDFESVAEQYQTNPHDPLFLLLLMEQLSYMEDRLCSHARRFLFQDFSQTIDSDRIVIVETYFKEIFYDFNSHIKGLIYKEKSSDSSIAHYAIHFQIPIIQSSIEPNGRKKICILCDTKEIILHPKKYHLEQLHLHQQKKTTSTHREAIPIVDQYHFFATISHPYDVDFVWDSPWFEGIIFHPEYLIAAKGSPLTVEEWIHFISYIEQHSQHRSIAFRLPAFDKNVTTIDFDGGYPTKESLYHLPLYYHNYLMAIAKVMNASSSQINIHVPYVIEPSDVDDWIQTIKFMMHEFGYKHDFTVGFDLVFYKTINQYRYFRKSGQFVFNVDMIVADYATNFRPYYDWLSIDRFKESHAYADIIEIFQDYRKRYPSIQFLFTGLYLNQPSMFHGLLKGGYRNLGIHPRFMDDLIPIVEPRILNKGQYVGLHAYNQARSQYYRELREKLGPDAVIELGTYKKMLLEKESEENK